MKDHATLSEQFIADEPRTDWHDETLWFVREKRDKAVRQVPEWEQLREMASQIKDHSLSNLDIYLTEFEKNAQANGIKVHWAADSSEHNALILKIIRDNKVWRVVKSKSMLTEECHLNNFLIEQGVEVVDTDLGERIVQFRNESPTLPQTGRRPVRHPQRLKREQYLRGVYKNACTVYDVFTSESLTFQVTHNAPFRAAMKDDAVFLPDLGAQRHAANERGTLPPAPSRPGSPRPPRQRGGPGQARPERLRRLLDGHDRRRGSALVHRDLPAARRRRD